MGEKKDREPYLKQSKICFLSNFPPKECGIATFTNDLVNAIDNKFNPLLKSRIIALNEDEAFYNYDKKVVMEINKDDMEDFIVKAKKINESEDIRLVCVQHEFGLFGGDYGSYLISFLEAIEKPVVITFHSVLPCPDEKRKRVVRSLASRVEGIIVMAKKAKDILRDDYGIEEDKIFFIPHGIPNVQFHSPEVFKKKLRLDGKIVLSTFGLLSCGKGIEYVIRSLPDLVKKYPNLLYLIIGETHPNVRRQEGEKYRNQLIEEVEELGLKGHVKFYNKYLKLEEIINYLQASDIYVCTNLEKNQISSGTLSYAMGCGKAIISTPFIYAEEFLSGDRGVLSEFKNPVSFTNAIDKILSDKDFRKCIEKNAYSYTRPMTWSNVASNHLKLFNKIVKLRDDTIEKFPYIKLNHLRNMTDKFGMIQFSKHAVPDKESGYTVDDNARALISTILHNSIFDSKVSENLSRIYLDFLEYSQDESGWFNNVIMGDKIIDKSDDAFGRAFYALGYTVNKSKVEGFRDKAREMIDKSIVHVDNINSPRAKAFLILGLSHYYKEHPNEEILSKIKSSSDFLVRLYNEKTSHDWKWFENEITYSNSKLPEALFASYEITEDERYLEIAKESLDFLLGLTFIEDVLFPIGQNGWCNRNGERAFFDQQPVDSASIVSTLLLAYKITKDKAHYKKAILAFNWFLGKNHLNQMVYDEATGGCYDGLGKYSLNFNQGAESTLSYLMARLFLEEERRNRLS